MELSGDLLALLDAISSGGAHVYGETSPRALAIEGVDEKSCGGLVAYADWVDSRLSELKRHGLVEYVYRGHRGETVEPERASFYTIAVRVRPAAGLSVAKHLAEWRSRPRLHALSRPSSLAEPESSSSLEP